MALARVKVWNPGDVLTAADLNGEFNNVLNNPITLVSPTTGPINFNLQAHTNLIPAALTASSGSTGQVLTVNTAGTPVWATPGAVASTAGPRVLQVVGGAITAVTATSTTMTDATFIQITPASTNSRITLQYSFNAVVPNTAGANNSYQAQIATSSGVIPNSLHVAQAPSAAGGIGIDSDMAWTMLVNASTGPYPTSYKIQHLESSVGVNPSLNNFYGFLTEYSS